MRRLGRIEFGQNAAQNSDIGRFQTGQRGFHLAGADALSLDHIDHAFNRPANQRRIRQTQNRRTVDHHMVVSFQKPPDQIRQTVPGQQFSRVRRGRSGGHKVEVNLVHFGNHCRQIVIAGKNIAEAALIIAASQFMDRGRTHIAIDKDHFLTAAHQNRRERERGG